MSAPVVERKRVPRVVPGVLLALVALSAAFTIGVSLWASGYADGRPVDGEALFGVLFLVWGLAPFLAMGAVVVAAARSTRGAMVAVAVGVVVLAALTVWALLDFIGNESSTAALIFLFLPFYQLLLVIVTGVVALVVHLVVRRRRANRAPVADRSGEGSADHGVDLDLDE